MKYFQTCNKSPQPFNHFVYVGMHESFTPPPSSSGSDTPSKKLDYQEKLKKAESDMEAKIEAETKDLEQKFEKGGADAVGTAAKKTIGESRDAIIQTIKGLKLPSGPSSENQVALITTEKSIKEKAGAAMDDVDKEVKVFKAKKEYAEINSDLELTVRPQWENLNKKFLGLETWKNFNVTVSTPEEMAAVETNFSFLSTMVTDGSKVSKTLGEKIAKLKKLKGIDPDITKKLDHYLPLLDTAQKGVDDGVKLARETYNTKLAELQGSMKTSMEEAGKKSTEYQNASGRAQMEMDAGKMKADERVDAYNKFKDQQKYTQSLSQYSQKIKGIKPLGDSNKSENESPEANS